MPKFCVSKTTIVAIFTLLVLLGMSFTPANAQTTSRLGATFSTAPLSSSNLTIPAAFKTPIPEKSASQISLGTIDLRTHTARAVQVSPVIKSKASSSNISLSNLTLKAGRALNVHGAHLITPNTATASLEVLIDLSIVPSRNSRAIRNYAQAVIEVGFIY